MELKYIAEGGSVDLGGQKKACNRNYYEALLI